MPTTTYKGLPLPTQGVTTTWGDALNNYPFTYVDSMLGGITTKSISSIDVPLSVAESRTAILRLIGTLTANVLVTTICQGFTFVENLTSGNFTVTVNNAATFGGVGVGTPVAIPQGGGYVVAHDLVNGSRLMLPSAGAVASSVGRIAMFPGIYAPSGWLKANGSVISRANYPVLWTFAQACGNLKTEAEVLSGEYWGCFTTGDGSTTFRIPDFRGEFLRGWADDNTGSTDYGRNAGQYQGWGVQWHQHTGITGVESVAHTHGYSASVLPGGGTTTAGTSKLGIAQTGNPSVQHTHGFTTDGTGIVETRPQNLALLTCIAYL